MERNCVTVTNQTVRKYATGTLPQGVSYGELGIKIIIFLGHSNLLNKKSEVISIYKHIKKDIL